MVQGRFVVVLAVIVVLALLSLYVVFDRHEENNSERILEKLTSAPLRVNFKSVNSRSLDFEGDDAVYTAMLNGTKREDGTVKFDGWVSYYNETSDKYVKYGVVDGAGYFYTQSKSSYEVKEAGCLPVDAIPPMNELEASIRNARVVDKVNGIELECSGGKYIEVIFADEPYVFCSKDSDLMSSVFGEDMDAFVEDERSVVRSVKDEFNVPLDKGGNMLQCKKMQMVLKDSMPVHTRMLRAMNEYGKPGKYVRSTRGVCKGKIRPCLFIHGLRPLEEQVEEPIHGYWGKIQQHAPCCSSIHYTNMDTFRSTWYDAKMTNAICDAALALSSTFNSTTINDVIVVTHSMGGLILGSAIANNVCQLGDSSTWVSLQSPMEGTRSATTSKDICENINNPILQLVKIFMTKQSLCPIPPALQSFLYIDDGRHDDMVLNELKKMQHAYTTHVSAALCGTSSFGLLSKYSIPMAALSTISLHRDENDGIVEFKGCALGIEHKFDSRCKNNNFYKASINHVGKFSIQNIDEAFY